MTYLSLLHDYDKSLLNQIIICIDVIKENLRPKITCPFCVYKVCLW